MQGEIPSAIQLLSAEASMWLDEVYDLRAYDLQELTHKMVEMTFICERPEAALIAGEEIDDSGSTRHSLVKLFYGAGASRLHIDDPIPTPILDLPNHIDRSNTNSMIHAWQMFRVREGLKATNVKNLALGIEEITARHKVFENLRGTDMEYIFPQPEIITFLDEIIGVKIPIVDKPSRIDYIAKIVTQKDIARARKLLDQNNLTIPEPSYSMFGSWMQTPVGLQYLLNDHDQLLAIAQILHK